MKRFLLSLVLMIAFFGASAQEGYRISGKIDGVSDGLLLLVRKEFGKTDTLGSTGLTHGAFVFTGKVSSPTAVYLVSSDESVIIPLILENTDFMINANKSGVLIQGGEQQGLYNQFSKLNMLLLREKDRIQKEFQEAEEAGNKAKLHALAKQFEGVLEEARQAEGELLCEHADSYVAAHVIATVAGELELNEVKARYDLLGSRAKETAPGQFVAAFIEELEKFSVGNVAPDFSVKTREGDTISLYSVKGNLKLVAFWSSTDPYSRQENVNLLRVYQKYHLKGL